ncbi:hypothetical protein N7481_001540 [Penicillium waksmanii]|uniref:uncharacterized protein n=1 Tax=Penicillium waksmanii TaxID=69791 RepID=UPI0025467AC8|nr:uncharacterized protein N7481_001540 [Penicillium waksmanii]KAJ6001131.1 hypothetical protein N7481_001540 [Penicillium waksmanii]
MAKNKKLSENCSSDLLRSDNDRYDSLEGENCTSEHADSSKPEVPSRTTTPTKHHHALPPAAKPESRPSPTFRSESIERSQSSELKQPSWNYQAEALIPRGLNTGQQKGKNRPTRRQRSMSRKRKERRRQTSDGTNLTTPCEFCMGSKAS